MSIIHFHTVMWNVDPRNWLQKWIYENDQISKKIQFRIQVEIAWFQDYFSKSEREPRTFSLSSDTSQSCHPSTCCTAHYSIVSVQKIAVESTYNFRFNFFCLWIQILIHELNWMRFQPDPDPHHCFHKGYYWGLSKTSFLYNRLPWIIIHIIQCTILIQCSNLDYNSMLSSF